MLRLCERLGIALDAFDGFPAERRVRLLAFERMREAEEARRDRRMGEMLAALAGGLGAKGIG